jgi:hypothetical protein
LKKAEDIGDSLISNFDSNPITSIPNNRMCLNSHKDGTNYMARMSELKRKLGLLKWYTNIFLVEINDSSLYTKNPTFFTPSHENDLAPDGSAAGGVYGSALLAELALCVEFVALSDRTGVVD